MSSNNINRYEEVFFFYPEGDLDNPANNSYQKRDVIKFFVNRKSLNWYNARLLISFKLTALNGNLVRVNDNNGMVNGAHSFIKKKLVLVLMGEKFIIVIMQIKS